MMIGIIYVPWKPPHAGDRKEAAPTEFFFSLLSIYDYEYDYDYLSYRILCKFQVVMITPTIRTCYTENYMHEICEMGQWDGRLSSNK